jgi:nucleoside-diphosphate-sugar epimerase
MPKALITGASGFVGSHLADHLAGLGWQLRAAVRPTSDTRRLKQLGAELVVGDIADKAFIRSACDGADVVYHLAAQVAGSVRGYEAVNVEGSRSIADGCAEAARPGRLVRLVYLSSYSACGPSVNGRARLSSEEPAPLTTYGRTKLRGEHAVREAEADGVAVSIIRAPVVYGPRDAALLTYFRLVQYRLVLLPAGGPRPVHLVFAPDLARALAMAANVPPGTYAVAEPAEHTWESVAQEMARAMGARPLRIRVPAAVVRSMGAAAGLLGRLSGRRVVFDRDKAAEMLASAWTCDLSGSERLLPASDATTLADGLALTIAWYRAEGWLR